MVIKTHHQLNKNGYRALSTLEVEGVLLKSTINSSSFQLFVQHCIINYHPVLN